MTKLTEYSVAYKPIYYPWAFDLARKHEGIHWVEDEIVLGDDVENWHRDLSEDEKGYVAGILRMFAQSDVNVAQSYHDHLIPTFKNNEVRNMLSSFAARECYDDQTEVLTNEGWKLFKDLNHKEKIAQYDLGGTISFAYKTDFICKHFKGNLHHYKSASFDLCVTPKHELILINPATGKVQKAESERGIWGRNFFCPVSGTISDYTESTEALDRLLVAVQADGTLKGLSKWSKANRKNERRCYIGVDKSRKKERLITLLNNAGIEFTTGLTGRFSFRIPDHIELATIKDFGWFSIDNISLSRAKWLLDELRYWDSTTLKNSPREAGSFQYYNTRKRAIDIVQALCIMTGRRGTIGINRNGEQAKLGRSPTTGDYFKSGKTCYRVSITNRVKSTYPKRKEVAYDGNVYCVTVPKGNIIVRRNGKQVISSNCIHQRAYALLNDTLGLPESDYSAFLYDDTLREKNEFMTSREDSLVLQMAKQVFGEGVMLFGSFAMLLNFHRRGLMPGMVTVTRWSLRDESLHVQGVTRLLREYVKESGKRMGRYQADIYTLAAQCYYMEEAFIKYVYNDYHIEGLEINEILDYIRYMIDRRLIQMGVRGYFNERDNPLPWIDDLVGSDKLENFFETRVTEYNSIGMSGEYTYGV